MMLPGLCPDGRCQGVGADETFTHLRQVTSTAWDTGSDPGGEVERATAYAP